jgi:hypothetical protein
MMVAAAGCSTPVSTQNQAGSTPSPSPAPTATAAVATAPPISFSGTAVCRGSNVTPCSAKLAYSGGTPGLTPSAAVVGFAQYCPSAFCYPVPRALPPGFSLTVGGGFVIVSVQADCGGAATGGCPNGWGGVIKVSLTDQSTCSAGTNCGSTGIGDFTIDIAGG